MNKKPIALAVLVLMMATACGSGGFSGLYGAPLPGGADVGDHPYRVTAQFANVLDLVPQAAVKVNEVAVGKVDQITLGADNRTAQVNLVVNRNATLPANATAELRQSSLLGEKYVQLGAPKHHQPRGRLGDGAVIQQSETNRNVQVEEVLGALSMLLNGGGIGQLHNITTELNNALSGNEDQIKSLLSNVNTLVADLDGQKDNITRAIDGLNRLAETLSTQRQNIAVTLDGIAPGLKVLTEQRDQLVGMLHSLDNLSGTAVNTINKSKDDLVADLKALAPTVDKLAEAGQNLPHSLQILATFPFTDYASTAAKGDYLNVNITANLNLSEVVDHLTRSPQPLIPLLGLPTSGTRADPDAPPLPLPPTTQPPATGGAPHHTPATGPKPAAEGNMLENLLGSVLGGGR